MKKLNNSGFTLVELLAVIVVLALLMVVAASSIGNSLNNAKKSAMATEAEKVVAKTYEDVKMMDVSDTFTYTYAGVDAGEGAKDGDYHILIDFDATDTDKMVAVCITDGKNKSVGTISEATVTWTRQFESGTSCSGFTIAQASPSSSSSSS